VELNQRIGGAQRSRENLGEVGRLDLGLRERVAIVAGASRGIGFATAVRLGYEGTRLVICARGRERLDAAAHAVRTETGADVLALALDLTRAEDVKELIRQTLDRHDRLDVLVANTGGPRYASFSAASPDLWEESFRTVVHSTVLLCREAIPAMQSRRWGRIVCMGSITALRPLPNLVLASAMRSALLGLTKALAQEVAPCGITVNAVCPGYIHTDTFLANLWDRARQSGLSVEAALADLEKRIPMGRVGRPEELASLIAFLTSEAAGYMTGSVLPMDGGLLQAA